MLRGLPSTLGTFASKVKALDLSESELSALGSEIEGCTALKTLNLASTLVESLPPIIGRCSSLEKINLRRCSNLASLPEDGWDRARLPLISLQGCVKLTSLPDALLDDNGKYLGQDELLPKQLRRFANLQTMAPRHLHGPELREQLVARGVPEEQLQGLSVAELRARLESSADAEEAAADAEAGESEDESEAADEDDADDAEDEWDEGSE